MTQQRIVSVLSRSELKGNSNMHSWGMYGISYIFVGVILGNYWLVCREKTLFVYRCLKSYFWLCYDHHTAVLVATVYTVGYMYYV